MYLKFCESCGVLKICEICKTVKPFQRRHEGELLSKHSEIPMKIKLYIDTSSGPLTTS